MTLAQAPAWWSMRGVLLSGPNVTTNDYAPINQGQLKWIATQAAAEFAANGLTSTDLTALVTSFTQNGNYHPVNAGQLKFVSKPFYDLLWTNGLTYCYPQGAGTPYPWSNSTNHPNDFALANIGQAKWLFSFDLSSTSNTESNDSGLPDWWQLKYFGHLGVDPNADPDGDGLTNLGEYHFGANPNWADADPNLDPNGDGLTIAERNALNIPAGEHVNLVMLGPNDITFEVKAVESDRDKTISIREYESPTNSYPKPAYFLQQEEHELLNDSGTIEYPGYHGETDPYSILWQHDFVETMDLTNSAFNGSWSYTWHYKGEDQYHWGKFYSFDEISQGSAAWTSNSICSGNNSYVFSDHTYYDWNDFSLDTQTNITETWNDENHNLIYPHPGFCSSNGYSPTIFNFAVPASIYPLLYTNQACSTNQMLNTIIFLLGASGCTNGIDTWTLSQEFTTPLLQQVVTNDLNRDGAFNSMAWGAEWDYERYGTRSTNTVNQPTACRHLSDDEVYLAERKALYHVIVDTNNFVLETGTVYRINLVHLFSPDGACSNIILSSTNYDALYTGGSQLVFNVAGTLLDVPPSNGEVTVSAIQIQFMNVAGRITNGLSVSKWPNAFSTNSYSRADYTNNPSFSDNTYGNVNFDNNFIDSDPDRFYIQVTDYSKCGAGTISVMLSTECLVSDYNNPPVEVELTETQPSSGIFQGKSCVVVSNPIDDQDGDFVISECDNNEKGDRTFLAQVGGKVKITYTANATSTITGECKVPTRYSLTVNVVILCSEDEDPVIDPEEVANHLKILREAYAQIGLHVTTRTSMVSYPANVCPTNLFICQTNWLLTEDTRNLLNLTGAKSSLDYIHLIYISEGKLRVGDKDSFFGVTLVPAGLSDEDKRYANNCIINGVLAHPFTAAHELGHALGLVYHNNSEPWNIMFGWHEGGATSAHNNSLKNSKRLNTGQETRVVTNVHLRSLQ